jgi:hypothetical protein
MREYSSREMPEGFLDKGVAAFFDWEGAGVEELGKERILRTSAADAPAIVVVCLEIRSALSATDPRSVRTAQLQVVLIARLAHAVHHTPLTSSPESVS